MFSVVKNVLASISVIFSATLFLSVGFPLSASAVVACTPENTVMNIVSHQDDDLLFQNPDIQNSVALGHCVHTVYTSAGEAGRAHPEYINYMLGRDGGARAAYAQMAGVATDTPWTEADITVGAHVISHFTLNGHENISLTFLHLPDGFDGTGPNSPQRLWENTTPSIGLVGSASYTRQEVIDVLLTLMNTFQPGRINTQDFVEAFGNGDHSDHHATGRFTQAAHALYTTPHTIHSYEGYNTPSHAPGEVDGDGNVFGQNFIDKVKAFLTYASFDTDLIFSSDFCQNRSVCGGWYGNWLKRQYTNGMELGGMVTMTASTIGNGSIESTPAGISCGMGGSMCSVTLANGASVVLHATPDAGWAFIGWTGACSGTGDCALTLSANVSVSATFVETSSCELVTSNVVSDTSDMTSVETTAVATTISPLWASIPGATWIWNSLQAAQGESQTFTKTFTVTGSPTGSIVIASDDNYEASLNGTEFAVIADVDNFTDLTKDTFDVTSLLVPGTNTLVISVHNIVDAFAEVNPAGLSYNLTLSENICTTIVPPTPPAPTGGSGGGATPPACADGSDNDGDGMADYPQDPGCADSLDNNEVDPVVEVIAPTTGGTDPVSTSTGEVLGAATVEPALPPQCTAYLTSYLGMGKNNDVEEVKKLQLFLNETLGTSIPVNGFFGSMTRSAVKKFQKQYHNEILQPWIDAGFSVGSLREGTGYVFKTTKRWINMMKCTSEVIPMPELK